ncbi:hypothetical protein PHMEG_00034508 [Phytophthora megakarya]|uniref:Uncharacterized protein n=1 Tax=Phytophthora megakarya TaxID=4795 RepID=A0A225URA4_9STRA|nr:hypothetical protein PHMEG_00034508 [Phytophthora megakarya]
MDPEALGLMVEGEFPFSRCSSVSLLTDRWLIHLNTEFELDKIDWETLAPD